MPISSRKSSESNSPLHLMVNNKKFISPLEDLYEQRAARTQYGKKFMIESILTKCDNDNSPMAIQNK
jgi:hypothetical protein